MLTSRALAVGQTTIADEEIEQEAAKEALQKLLVSVPTSDRVLPSSIDHTLTVPSLL
jgi:hypothetical protein